MSFDDIRKSWQNEVTRPLSADELQRHLLAVQWRYDTLERTIHRRDLREIVAALFVVGAFAAGWPIYRASLVACVGVAIIILSAPVIVYVLIAANRTASTPPGLSVLDFSRQRLAWIDRQIRLLKNVVWWYVAPLMTGCMLVAWGLTAGRWAAFIQLAVMNLLVAVVVIWMNRRAVRDGLLPARQELAGLIEMLEGEPAGE